MKKRPGGNEGNRRTASYALISIEKSLRRGKRRAGARYPRLPDVWMNESSSRLLKSVKVVRPRQSLALAARRFYWGQVRQMIAKCLLLLAVLLMPFGMTPATAGAGDGPAAAMRHCSESGDVHHGKGGIAECTMACAAALPACMMHPPQPLEIAPSQQALAPTKLLGNVPPDTRTPPPRQS